jgi:BirA family transcriptional regulator, biotin operon repressor / biotin---[acetyl-CoA-carboxylase] ligase
LIDAEEIKKNLHTKIIGTKLFSYDSIDSTNAFAKTLIGNEPSDGTVIVAEEQTSGRGRFNRKWESEIEKNLTFSVILQPTTQLENIGFLPICTGGVIAKAIEQHLNVKVECKWPNDILIDGKKICGILIESFSLNKSTNQFILGIGVNVNQEIFSDDIINTATSLKLVTGKTVDRIKLLTNILSSLDEMYINIQKGNYDQSLNEWKWRSTIFGKDITVIQFDKEIRGRAIRLDNDGGLVLNYEGTEIKVLSGDVTIRKF